jgi:hypothetical protein
MHVRHGGNYGVAARLARYELDDARLRRFSERFEKIVPESLLIALADIFNNLRGVEEVVAIL